MVQFISLEKTNLFCRGDAHLDLTVYASKTFTQWTLWKLGTKSCNDASAIASMKMMMVE
jgi:hypothetical protein